MILPWLPGDSHLQEALGSSVLAPRGTQEESHLLVWTQLCCLPQLPCEMPTALQ